MRDFCDFIEDGYTEPGYIAAVPGMNGELRFTFRLCDPVEQGQLLEVSDKLPLDQYRRVISDAIAPKIQSWTLKARSGSLVSVNPDNLRKIRPVLFRRLANIVMGLEPSDEDPQWVEQSKQAAAQVAAQVATTGQSTGAVKAVADLGNSGAVSG